MTSVVGMHNENKKTVLYGLVSLNLQLFAFMVVQLLCSRDAKEQRAFQDMAIAECELLHI